MLFTPRSIIQRISKDACIKAMRLMLWRFSQALTAVTQWALEARQNAFPKYMLNPETSR